MNNLRCHALIVGSGPGGQVTAHRLMEAGLEVITVERGPTRTEAGDPTHHSWSEICQMYAAGGATPALGLRPVTVAEASCVGGGSEINAGLYWRLPGKIRSKWEKELNLPDLSDAAMNSIYAKIENHLTFSQNGQKKISQKLAAGAESAKMNYLPAQKINSLKWIPSGKIFSRSYVKEFKCNGDRVVSAKVQTPGGPVSVEFDHLFLCAGATGTPQILRNVKWSRSAGKHIQFHPMVKVIAEFAEPVNDLSAFVESGQAQSDDLENTVLSCSLSSAGFISAGLAEQNKNVPLQDLQKFAVYSVHLSAGATLGFGFLGASALLSRLNRSDVVQIDRGVEALKKCLLASGAKQLYVAPKNAVSRISALHLFGGCSLGGKVTDPFGRLHGKSNVRINDTSMLPGSPLVNPQGTLMALAWRNMDHFFSESL